MTMEENAVLETLGLSGTEVKTYLALLELGSVSAGEIIKKTELHRGAVYDALERLIEKGLVSYVIKANRKYFETASTKRFLDVIAKKHEQLEQDKLKLLQIMPALESRRKLGKAPQEATLFKGNKGLQSIFQDFLDEKQEILVLGAYTTEATALQYFMKFNLPRFHKQRIKQKQTMKYIFPEQSILRAKQVSEYQYTPVRILKAPFASLSSIQIYGDKTAIILWSSDPMGVIIRSKEIAQSYRDYFNALWNMAKPIK